ncbi:MAG: hydroxyacid dehydrogenase [Actinobacteria bacterium]|nr:hydroxyacid dehydrogenase [Actinomycetota bacterium]
MTELTILFTTEQSPLREVYFPPSIRTQLEELGEVRYHDGPDPLTADALADLLPGVDVCVTHWTCPQFTADVLDRADRLRLIAHAAGSVADLVTSSVYEQGITVTSANTAMASHVAEGVLSYLLADLHRIPERSQLMREGGWLSPADRPTASLSQLTVGLVGLGTVGRRLVELLRPFGVRVLAHDPFVPAAHIRALGAHPASLDDLLRDADVVSLHASLTPQTLGLLDASRLDLIRDGCLLINTARAALVDEDALERTLASGRIRAVLDVFETEPLPPDSPLRTLPNVTLQPHTAGSSSGPDLAALAVREVARLGNGEPPLHPVSFENYRLMTRDALP